MVFVFRNSRYENLVNHMIETYVTIGQQCSFVALTTVLNENSSNLGNVTLRANVAKA